MSKGFNKVGTNGNGSNGSNGSATAALVNVTETAVIEEAVVVEEVKEEVKTPPPPPPAPVIKPVPVLTLEQKLEKVDELNRIIAKYQRLMDARKNLNTFKIGSDGLNLTIIIKDASGQEFKTSHNVVVETVLSTVRQILNERISDVEKDINFSD
jgi:hypothetical protein